MKFKALISLLLTLSLVLLLISCNETPPTQTTTGETTTAETTAETTSAEILKNQRPKPWSTLICMEQHPWTLSPNYERANAELYDFTIELLSPDFDYHEIGYTMLPTTFVLKITNKTNLPIMQYGSAYIEMYEKTAYGEELGAWVRLPYVNLTENKEGVFVHESEYEYVLDLTQNLHSYMETSFDFRYFLNNSTEDAKCRIVLYLNDGPHYVEFVLYNNDND